jgi:mono/diheme cytochrome c family protein
VKRRILKIFKNIAFVFLITCSVGCLNNIEDVTGTVQSNVSFSADVQPIMQQHCVSCHNNNFANNNFNATSYESILSGSGTVYGNQIVVPNEPDQSGLVDIIEPNPESGLQRMPTGGSLSGDEIQIIRAWIREGAQNN